MPAKSVTVSDNIYNRVYQISQAENKSTSKVMGEIIETALDEEMCDQLFELKTKKNGFFIDILKDVIKKGLK